MQNKQRLELADYEAENLARLQKTFSRKWEFIFMQAEAQAKSVSFSSYMHCCYPCYQAVGYAVQHNSVPIQREIGSVVTGKVSGVKMVGMMEAEGAMATQMSWCRDGPSAWMPVLASLAPNKTRNIVGFELLLMILIIIIITRNVGQCPT